MNATPSMDTASAEHRHREFLNQYYGVSRYFYDITRRYYLFGRDRLVEQLGRESWERLVEVGPGTGRNLRRLHELKPSAKLGGIDASDAMLDWAQKRCPFAALAQGFAEQADLAALLGSAPDRVLYSYCLSMVGEPMRALDHTISQLAPGGEVAIVDFGDLRGLPGPAARALRSWIGAFHVNPVDQNALLARGARIEQGPARYYFIARITRR